MLKTRRRMSAPTLTPAPSPTRPLIIDSTMVEADQETLSTTATTTSPALSTPRLATTSATALPTTLALNAGPDKDGLTGIPKPKGDATIRDISIPSSGVSFSNQEERTLKKKLYSMQTELTDVRYRLDISQDELKAKSMRIQELETFIHSISQHQILEHFHLSRIRRQVCLKARELTLNLTPNKYSVSSGSVGDSRNSRTHRDPHSSDPYTYSPSNLHLEPDTVTAVTTANDATTTDTLDFLTALSSDLLSIADRMLAKIHASTTPDYQSLVDLFVWESSGSEQVLRGAAATVDVASEDANTDSGVYRPYGDNGDVDAIMKDKEEECQDDENDDYLQTSARNAILRKGKKNEDGCIELASGNTAAMDNDSANRKVWSERGAG
ncbi:hypothetical protein K435DRAFT_846035 [Dendrothele bispora CBS 962.96]|uniref:Uncharacterized protein n=1 Tax=Dendrothele bispora (strain CBS 962.96) TaxID=1314807 RepID=A0A4S8KQ63_DENBC|nr:hypothetical protein K435DRAFT_974044 [Dendrothele bispora CBS 962.96]THU77837.1 hypothetical protein K435DRAFT_846035 [Dendrothele bispora CBS 962.96]